MIKRYPLDNNSQQSKYHTVIAKIKQHLRIYPIKLMVVLSFTTWYLSYEIFDGTVSPLLIKLFKFVPERVT